VSAQPPPHAPNHYTEGEVAAARGLRQSKALNSPQMAMTEESRQLLTALLRDEMSSAVAHGIKASLTPEVANQFATVMIVAFKAQLNASVNATAGGMVRAAVSKVFGYLIVGMMIYWIGGWSALAGIVNWIKPGFLK
jgi:hypothetical protein